MATSYIRCCWRCWVSGTIWKFLPVNFEP